MLGRQIIKVLKTKYFKGFTLAEVLITLAIMGALMAITLPAFMQNTFNNSYTSTLKKTYGMLEQATNTIMLSNSGTLEGAFSSTADALTKYGKLLEINKTCSAGSVAGNCWANTSKSLSGGAIQEGFNANANYQGAVLADGTSLLFYISNTACNGAGVSVNLPYSSDPNHLCGYIVADINGLKNGPNQFGKDGYMLLLGPKGLLPAGDPHTVYSDLDANCNPADTSHNGYGCASPYLTGIQEVAAAPPPPDTPSCTPLATETRTSTPCPGGQTGTITEQRTSSCPGPVWSGWSVTSNTCTPAPDEWCPYTWDGGSHWDCEQCPAGSGGASTQEECWNWL